MKSNVLIMCLIATAVYGCAPNEPVDHAEPATSTASSELGNACTIQCNNARLQCESVCERFPRPNCEENCDTRFINCMHACGCPFNEEFDRTSSFATPTNTYICVGTSNPGLTYQKYNTFKRTEHVRRTLECDGTITEVVLSTTDTPTGPCYHKLFPDTPCSPVQTPGGPGLCTF